MVKSKLIFLYLFAITAANLLVKHYGARGLWFSSFFLIPFDFIVRCYFHETWERSRLVLYLFLLTCAASIITIIINLSAYNIAIASVLGIAAAQLSAGVFYQNFKNKSYFFKVNLSDLVAIIFDSCVFQFVAFSVIDPEITIGQIIVKFSGGLLWYYILIKKLKIQNHVKNNRQVQRV